MQKEESCQIAKTHQQALKCITRERSRRPRDRISPSLRKEMLKGFTIKDEFTIVTAFAFIRLALVLTRTLQESTATNLPADTLEILPFTWLYNCRIVLGGPNRSWCRCTTSFTTRSSNKSSVRTMVAMNSFYFTLYNNLGRGLVVHYRILKHNRAHMEPTVHIRRIRKTDLRDETTHRAKRNRQPSSPTRTRRKNLPRQGIRIPRAPHSTTHAHGNAL